MGQNGAMRPRRIGGGASGDASLVGYEPLPQVLLGRKP
jgi:hypothetical protein